MGRDLTPDELDELLASYSLDAVDDDERAQVDAWITRNPRARRDVDELRATASMLTSPFGVDDDVPTDLWTRIEAQLSEAPPPLRLAPVVEARPPSRRPWILGIAAALVLAIVVAVGVIEVRRNSDQDARIKEIAAGMHGRAMERAAAAAAMEPDARVAELTSGDGTVMASIVTTADGRGYVMVDKLPKLREGQTYQLWALMPEGMSPTMVSVGVLGRNPTMSAFTADTRVTGYGLTMEHAPGVTATNQPMMIEGRLA